MTMPALLVDEWEIRCKFRKAGYAARIQSGDLREHIEKSNHPSKPGAGQPHCTKSQFVSYYDSDGRELVRAHQYRRPDGSLGASGLPDPKVLVYRGILYTVRTSRVPSEGRGDRPSRATLLVERIFRALRCWLLSR